MIWQCNIPESTTLSRIGGIYSDTRNMHTDSNLFVFHLFSAWLHFTMIIAYNIIWYKMYHLLKGIVLVTWTVFCHCRLHKISIKIFLAARQQLFLHFIVYFSNFLWSVASDEKTSQSHNTHPTCVFEGVNARLYVWHKRTIGVWMEAAVE